MRKVVFSLVIAVCLFVPVLAGDVNSPGKTDPPSPCTVNCVNSGTTITTKLISPLGQFAIQLLLGIY